MLLYARSASVTRSASRAMASACRRSASDSRGLWKRTRLFVLSALASTAGSPSSSAMSSASSIRSAATARFPEKKCNRPSCAASVATSASGSSPASTENASSMSFEPLVRAAAKVEHPAEGSRDSRPVVRRACLLAELERGAKMRLGRRRSDRRHARARPRVRGDVRARAGRRRARPRSRMRAVRLRARRARLHVRPRARATHARAP